MARTSGHRRECPTGQEVSPRDACYVPAKKVVRVGDASFLNDGIHSQGPHPGIVRDEPFGMSDMSASAGKGVGQRFSFYNPLWDEEDYGSLGSAGGEDVAMRPSTPPPLARLELPRSRESLLVSEPSTSSAFSSSSSSSSARTFAPMRRSEIVSVPVIEPRRAGKGPMLAPHAGRSFPDAESEDSDEEVLLNDLIAPRRVDKGKSPADADALLPGGMDLDDEGPPAGDAKGKGVLLGPSPPRDWLGPAAGSLPSSSSSTSLSGARPPAARTLALALALPTQRASPWTSAESSLMSSASDSRPTTPALAALLAMEVEEQETRAALEHRILATTPEGDEAAVVDPTAGGRPQSAPARTAALLGGAPAVRMVVRRYKGAVGEEGPPAYVGYIHVPWGAGGGQEGQEHVIALEGRRLKRRSRTHHITLRAEAGGAGAAAAAPPLWTGRLRSRQCNKLFTLLEDTASVTAPGIPVQAPPRPPKAGEAGSKEGAAPGGNVLGGAVEGIPLFVPQPAPVAASPPTFAPRAVAPSPGPAPADGEDGEGVTVGAAHPVDAVDMDACLGRAPKVDLGRKVLRVGFRHTSLLNRGGPRNLFVEPVASAAALGGKAKGGRWGKVSPAEAGKGGGGLVGGGSPALQTRRATWDPAIKAYTLDFGGAGYQPSVKNMQLVAAPEAAAAPRTECPWQRSRRALRIGGGSCEGIPSAACCRSRPGSAPARVQVAAGGGGGWGGEPLTLQMGKRSGDTFEVLFSGGGIDAARAFAIAIANLEGSCYFVS